MKRFLWMFIVLAACLFVGLAAVFVIAGETTTKEPVNPQIDISNQHQGINVQKKGLMVKPAAGKTIWFECRFKAANPTKLQGFICQSDGVSQPTLTIDYYRVFQLR